MQTFTFLLLMILPTTSPDEYPIRGIDVSHHQGKINWASVRDQGIRFCFIKCTEGRSLRDSLFDRNRADAVRNSLIVGAYHYFNFCVEGEDQARNFVQGMRTGRLDLPPVVDIEYVGNCRKIPERERLMHSFEAFLRMVEDSMGVPPIIYTTEEFYVDYLRDRFANHAFWVRNLKDRPVSYEKRRVLFWQHDINRVDGVGTRVDRNRFLGDSAQFEGVRVAPTGANHP